MNTSGPDRPALPDRPDQWDWYELRLQGRLQPRWSGWLADMIVTPGADGTTVLRGPVVDQAALHGLLAQIRDLGLPLLSIARLEPNDPPDTLDPPTGDRP